jgi:hypothetical protein
MGNSDSSLKRLGRKEILATVVSNKCEFSVCSSFVPKSFVVYHSTALVSNALQRRVAQEMQTLREHCSADQSNALHCTMVDPDRYSVVTEIEKQWGDKKPYQHRQWCPTEIDIDWENQKVLGMSHVEHVDQQQFAGVYQSLMHVFECALPVLPRILAESEASVICNRHPDADDEQQQHKSKSKSKKRNREQQLNKQLDHKLQVVVKIKELNMAPQSVYEGFWHIEGTRHERIVAVVLYYYKFDTLLEVCARQHPVSNNRSQLMSVIAG